MDPQGSFLATARGDRGVGRGKARGDADARNRDCTSRSTIRSIEAGTPAMAAGFADHVWICDEIVALLD
jgi:hypothetical protein